MTCNDTSHGATTRGQYTANCSDLQGSDWSSPLQKLLTGFQSSQNCLLASAAPVRVTDVHKFNDEQNTTEMKGAASA